MKNFKQKLETEFLDLLSWVALLFTSMVILATFGCAPIAATCLLIIYVLGIAYPIRWLFLAFRHYRNAGYLIIAYGLTEEYDEAIHQFYYKGEVLAARRSLFGVKRFVRKNFGFFKPKITEDGTIKNKRYPDGAILRLACVSDTLNKGYSKLEAHRIEDYADRAKYFDTDKYVFVN